MTVEITGEYLGGKKCRLTHGPSGSLLNTAAPVDNQGDGSSFSPTDLVAAALASGMMPPSGWAGAGFLVTPPSNLEAYRQFIAGSELLGVDYPRAIDYLERASELDPDYRLARGWLAAAYLNLGRWHEADEIMQQLIRSSDRATQLERLLEGVCMAWLHGNYADELQIWRQIEKLDHVSWGGKYFTGLAAMCLNRPQEAVDAFEKGKSDVMSGLLRGVNQMWYWRNFTAARNTLSAVARLAGNDLLAF